MFLGLLSPFVCLGRLGVELLGPCERVLRLGLETLHLLLDGVHLGMMASVGSASSAPSLVRILPGAAHKYMNSRLRVPRLSLAARVKFTQPKICPLTKEMFQMVVSQGTDSNVIFKSVCACVMRTRNQHAASLSYFIYSPLPSPVKTGGSYLERASPVPSPRSAPPTLRRRCQGTAKRQSCSGLLGWPERSRERGHGRKCLERRSRDARQLQIQLYPLLFPR